MDEFPVDTIPQGAVEDVYTTHVTNQEQFYVHIGSRSSILEAIMEVLESRYSDLGSRDKLLSHTERGTLCAAKFTDDDNWYRAKITGVLQSGLIEVQFVDYGNTDFVSTDRLKVLDSDLIIYPVQSYRCSLAGVSCSLGFWTPELMVQFEDLVLDKKCSAVFHSQRDDDIYFVEMYDEQGSSINKMFGASEVRGVHAAGDVKMDGFRGNGRGSASGFKPMLWKVGDRIQASVVHVDNPDLFWCQEVSFSNDILILSEDLSRLHMTQEIVPLENVQAGFICAAKFHEDEAWYRGVVKSVSRTEAEVYFVDYGNTEMVELQYVCQLKPSMQELPALAVKCKLANVDKGKMKIWSNEAAEEFEKMVIDREFEVKVANKFDDTYLITLLDVEENVDISSQLQKFVHALPEDVAEPPPPAISRQSSTSEKGPEMPVGSTSFVFLSWVENPAEFWVQHEDSVELLDKLSEDLQEHYAQPRPVASPAPGAFVIARFSQDQLWYRGLIVKVNEDTVKVLFIDYGNSDIISMDELRQVIPQFGQMNPLAFKCSLAGVKPLKQDNTWSVDAKDFLEKLTENGCMCSVVSKSETVRNIELKVEGRDVAQELVALAVVSGNKVFRSQPQYPVYADKAIVKKNQTEKVEVTFVDSPSSFWCQLLKDTEQLDGLMEKLDSHYSENGGTPVSNPVMGQACVAQYSEDNAWYRAVVTNILDSGYQVKFVDYGNSEVVDHSLVCVPEPRFLDMPTQAILCSLSFPGNVTHLTDTFSDLVMSKELVLKVVEIKGDLAIVQLFDGDQSVADQLQIMSKKISSTSVTLCPATSITVGSTVQAYVSVVKSPNDFFLQIAGVEENLNGLMEQLSELYETNAIPAVSEPAVGVICVAQYSEDNMWYRGKITRVESKECHVLFVDYGNEEMIPKDLVKTMTPEIANMPVLAYQCGLYGFKSDSSSGDQKEKFEAMVMEKELSCTFMSKSAVKIVDEGQDIGEKMNPKPAFSSPKASAQDTGSNGVWGHVTMEDQNGFDEPVNRSPQKSGFGSRRQESNSNESGGFGSVSFGSKKGQFGKESGSFQQRDTPSGSQEGFTYKYPSSQPESAILVHLEEDGTFYVQLPSMERDILFLAKRLAGSYKGGGGPRLKGNADEGTACCSKFTDGSMYRCVVEKVNGNRVLVRYVDFGNTHECSVMDLKFLFPDLLEYPVQAYPCKLEGLEWSIDLAQKFADATLDKDLEVTFKSQAHPYLVNIQTAEGDLCCLLTGKPTQPAKKKSFGFSSSNKSPTQSKSSPPTKASPFAKESPPIKQIAAPKQEFTPHSQRTGSRGAFISHIEDSGCFYVQFEEDTGTLESVQVKLTSLSSDIPHPDLTTHNAACAAMFSEDSEWYRARISGTEKGNYMVQFIDYGNCDVVPSENIKPLTSELLAIAPLAYQCKFPNVEGFSDDNRSNLETYLLEYRLNVTLTSASQPYEVSITTEEGDDLEEIVCPSNRYRSYSIPKEVVPSHVSHIVDDGRFFLQLYKDCKLICDLEQELQEHYSQDSEVVENVVPEVPCCVKSGDDKWCRAKVKQIKDASIEIVFVDHGTEACVSVDRVKVLYPEFLKKPAYAFECRLKDVQNWTDNLKQKFTEMTGDKILNATFYTSDVPYRVSLARSIELDLLGLNAPIPESPRRNVQNELSGSPEKSVSGENQSMLELVTGEIPSSSANHSNNCTGEEGNVERMTVTVCSLVSPSQFYIQLQKDEPALDALTDSLYEHFSNLEEGDGTVESATVGELYGTSFDNELWNRVRVDIINSDGTIDVFDVDDGNVVTLTDLTHLSQLSSELKEIPHQARESRHAGVTPNGTDWTEEAIEEFRNLVEGKSLVADVKNVSSTKPLVVQLLDMGTPIQDVLINKGFGEKLAEEALGNSAKQVFADDEETVLQQAVQGLSLAGNAQPKFKIGTISDSDIEELKPMSAYVCYTASPSRFWCQMPTASVEELSDDLANTYTSCQSLFEQSQDVAEGDLVIAHIVDDDLWYRCKVIGAVKKETNDESPYSISVQFIDYGDGADVSTDKVYEMREEFTKLPVQAFCCALDEFQSVDTDEWSPEASARFSELVLDQEITLTLVGRKQDGTLLVNLVVIETNVSVASQLKEEQLVKVTQETSSKCEDTGKSYVDDDLEITHPILESTAIQGDQTVNCQSFSFDTAIDGPYKCIRLTLHTEYDVFVSDDELPNAFCVQLRELSLQYSTMMDAIAEYISTYSEEEKDVELEVGDACLVQYCELWYRGLISKHSLQGDYVVNVVDCGWEVNVNSSKVKTLPSQFLELPVQGQHCYLAGVVSVEPEWNEDALNAFTSFVKNHRLCMYIVEEVADGGKYGVFLSDLESPDSKSINMDLVDMGYAQAVPGSNMDVQLEMDQTLDTIDKTMDTEMLEDLEVSFSEMAMGVENNFGNDNDETKECSTACSGPPSFHEDTDGEDDSELTANEDESLSSKASESTHSVNDISEVASEVEEKSGVAPNGEESSSKEQGAGESSDEHDSEESSTEHKTEESSIEQGPEESSSDQDIEESSTQQDNDESSNHQDNDESSKEPEAHSQEVISSSDLQDENKNIMIVEANEKSGDAPVVKQEEEEIFEDTVETNEG